MSKRIKLYSFADVDRSGKVRWTAEELGYDIEESRLSFPAQREDKYRALNPYTQIPTVELDGEIYIESTAIALILAERHPEFKLIPQGERERSLFWQSLSISGSTLEQNTVAYFLSGSGLVDSAWAGLVGESIAEQLQVFAAGMPEQGFICGEFSLADICAAYPLRIGIQADLLSLEGSLQKYIGRLMERPAARAARFFDSLISPAQ